MSQLTFNLIFGVFLRAVTLLLAGWLSAHGMMPQGSVEEWAGAVVLAALAVLWSLYQKYFAKQLIVTAAQLPRCTSVAAVQKAVSAGNGASFAEVIKA